MKEKKKRGKIIFITAACAVLFLLFFPRFSDAPLHPSPVWDVDVAGPVSAAGSVSDSNLIPFGTERNFGFITSGGDIVSREALFYGVVQGEDYYINYSAITQNLIVKDASGTILSVINTGGYPFICHDRLFVLDNDRCGLSEWDSSGTMLWKRRFSSMITAFDCSQHFSLVGFFHGEVVLLEKEGGIVYREIPTGSRIRAVYGAAISPEEDVFAVILGLDPQRLLLFTRSDETYRPLFSRNLDSEYRREIFITFSDADTLFFEQNYRMEFMDIRRKRIGFYPVEGTPIGIDVDQSREMVFIPSRYQEQKKIQILTRTGMAVASYYLPAGSKTVFQNGSLFFTSGGRIRRVDLVRE